MPKSPGAAIKSKCDSIENHLFRILEALDFLMQMRHSYILGYYVEPGRAEDLINEIENYDADTDKEFLLIKEFIERDETHQNIVVGMMLLSKLGAEALGIIADNREWYKKYR